MTIGNYLPPINLDKLVSSVRKNNGQAKLRVLPSGNSVKVNEFSQEAYTVDVNTVVNSVSALKIDSPEQAKQLTGEVASMIRQNPIEAGNTHSEIDAGMDSGHWVDLVG